MLGVFQDGSLGGAREYGYAFGPLGILSNATPSQPTMDNLPFNPAAGLYAGSDGGLWVSNATTPSELELTTRTSGADVALPGLQLGGGSISEGGGIVVLSYSPPQPSLSAGAHVFSQASNTRSFSLIGGNANSSITIGNERIDRTYDPNVPALPKMEVKGSPVKPGEKAPAAPPKNRIGNGSGRGSVSRGPSIPGATVITDPAAIADILGSLGDGADAALQEEIRRILGEQQQ